MHFRFRRMRHVIGVLHKIYPGTTSYRLSGAGVNVLADARSTVSWCNASDSIYRRLDLPGCHMQRYPFLQVVALQHGKSMRLNDISKHILQRIIKEYVTFPILLSNKKSFEMPNIPCHIISKGFQNPVIFSGEDIDLKALEEAILDLNVKNGKGANVEDVKSITWVKPVEVVKEPDICSASRNLLFSFPGCISVEEGGNRLFLSDVNHHRIIVFNINGKILDAIGSSPGFEDGEFEIAKLMRPAASFYHASEDCLYFVDSENHAIRRADMSRRVVETVFPLTDGNRRNKVSGLYGS
ncbi:nhl repeat-containing protein 2 [Phtheirospermum japonicum]|uniref:Nhl repeat-containing protein 2 n=1 Tax=Phtheirospermum japonicum TaxID=374723 RepID=A0A830DJP1_9LAMI|nr:nhl repeat-containing protein 2 [Phtheirospermum japonicum]